MKKITILLASMFVFATSAFADENLTDYCVTASLALLSLPSNARAATDEVEPIISLLSAHKSTSFPVEYRNFSGQCHKILMQYRVFKNSSLTQDTVHWFYILGKLRYN